MPDIDIVDSTWIGAKPAAVAPIVADPANWLRWWPGLDVVADEWRADKGMRWTVRARSARQSGWMEIWLEPAFDGTVLHYFLRLNAPPGRLTRRRRDRLIDGHRRSAKRSFWALGDQLDPDRWVRMAARPFDGGCDASLPGSLC